MIEIYKDIMRKVARIILGIEETRKRRKDSVYLKAKAKSRRNIGDVDLHCKNKGIFKR